MAPIYILCGLKRGEFDTSLMQLFLLWNASKYPKRLFLGSRDFIVLNYCTWPKILTLHRYRPSSDLSTFLVTGWGHTLIQDFFYSSGFLLPSRVHYLNFVSEYHPFWTGIREKCENAIVYNQNFAFVTFVTKKRKDPCSKFKNYVYAIFRWASRKEKNQVRIWIVGLSHRGR